MDRNIAVVGCGYWGKNLVRNFAGLGALHTICDSSLEVLGRFESLYPNVCVQSDLDAVLSDRQVRGIVIALPAALHYPVAKKALLAGKDVFVEKPLTSSTSEAEELVKIADENERILMVGHLMLYHPAIQVLKDHMRSGDLGEIYYLYATRVNLGQVRNDESALWRLAPHDISLFLYLLEGRPEVISGHGVSYVQPQLEDVVFITLRFPNRVLAHVHASWLDPHKTRQLTVVGSNKMAIFDDMAPEQKLKIFDKGVEVDCDATSVLSGALPLKSEEVFIPQVDPTEPLLLECRHFVECVECRSRPLSDGRQGLEVVRILAEVESRMKGRSSTTVRGEE